MDTYRIDTAADLHEVENTFHLRAPVGRMGKLLAQAELYRRIAGLPGAVVECGVYKGASLMRFLAFRRLFETDESRRVIGFDAFGRFPVAEGEQDAGFIARFEAEGGPGIARADLEAAIAAKGFGNVALVEGDIVATLPACLEANPALRIALLHLDMDVATPTRFALERLAPRMVPGGLVLFDDYGVVPGATEVADAFAASHGKRLEKLPFYSVPAFVVM